jgi:hypothetical protein
MAKIDPSQPQPVKKVVDEQGVVIEKIYNPSVGKYDVVVTTGPSYMTKRQEAMDAMSQILQGNPALWQVAGDLFVKNMDWPGAEELAERLQKMIDPKLLADEEDPALQAANQQIQQMAEEMEQLHGMLKQVANSMEVQELRIKEYDAETKRLSVVQAGMTPEQVQEIVMLTLRDTMVSHDMMPVVPEASPEQMGMLEQQMLGGGEMEAEAPQETMQ